MSIVIRIVGLAHESIIETPLAGRYIEAFDPHWNEDGAGCGNLITTDNVEFAQRFDDHSAALFFWKQQSPTVPLRDTDGKPNRPLTMFHCEMFDPEVE